MVYEKVVEILKQHSSMEGLDVTRKRPFKMRESIPWTL